MALSRCQNSYLLRISVCDLNEDWGGPNESLKVRHMFLRFGHFYCSIFSPNEELGVL
jgi:hypothetical protein